MPWFDRHGRGSGVGGGYSRRREYAQYAAGWRYLALEAQWLGAALRWCLPGYRGCVRFGSISEELPRDGIRRRALHSPVPDPGDSRLAPGVEEVDWARRVREAAVNQPGAFKMDGRMIDAPVLARADRIISLALMDD